jgi:hypothetical protein
MTFPHRHLFFEVDVEMQFLLALTTLGSVDLGHVKGHQDEQDGDAPLSWETQLNQPCDDIAAEHRELPFNCPPGFLSCPPVKTA